jgi:glycosyltransferase involved in cell wall biosynthesis
MRLLIATQVLDQDHPNLSFFVRWVAEFAKHCESVVVVASAVGKYDLPKNVTVYSLGKEVGLEHRSRVGRFVSLMISLRHDSDAVFVHMIPEFVVAGALPWKLFGKKVGLWYVHGTVSWYLKVASWFADSIFTVSPDSCRIKSSKVHVVGHGIDVSAIHPKPKTPNAPLSIISIGRIAPSKRIDVILDTFDLLKTAGFAFTATLVGGPGKPEDADYADDTKERAGILGVDYRGPLPHAQAIQALEGADIFISASETGSIDKAVLEAAAAGVVPVFSNPEFASVLDAPELQVEGTPESFADLIQGLADDADGRARLAKQVRDVVVKNHSLTNLIPKILAFYAA